MTGKTLASQMSVESSFRIVINGSVCLAVSYDAGSAIECAVYAIGSFTVIQWGNNGVLRAEV